MFDSSHKRKVTLRGASKQATSRDEDLSKAKDERAARQAAKRQQTAALTLQQGWRGAAARQRVRQQLRRDWLVAFGPVASQPDALVPPAELAGKVLPPILLAYQPRQQGAAWGAKPLPPALLRDTAALRGALALMLRSLGANDPTQSFMSLAAGSPESRLALLSQLKRLAALCCSVLGAPGCDPLTQTAAARVLSLLADAAKWSSCLAAAAGAAAAAGEQGKDSGAAAVAGVGGAAASDVTAAMLWLRERWLCFLAAAPMVAQAVRRLADLAEQAGAGDAADGGKSQQQQQQQQQAAPVPVAQLTAMMNSLILMQLRLQQQLLGGGVGAPAASPAAAGTAAAAGAAAAAAAARESGLSLLVTQVLTIPNLLPKLSPAAISLLTEPAAFAAALECAAAAAGSGKGSSPSGAPAAGLGPGEALWLLANLTGLLAGKKVRQGAAGSAASGQADGGKAAVEFLPPSPLLKPREAGGKGGGVALPFALAADALLHRAVGSGGGGSGAAEAANALQALWPFSEGSFAVQLLGALPMETFAHLFHSLLSLLDAAGAASRARRHGKSSGGSGGGSTKAAMGSARVLSALAFATPLLPQLWKWLGVAVGVPLEAPMQATRGWDIPTLGCGMRSVSPEAAEALGLFCRVYSHYLMVTDDHDFHESQAMFTLGQQRAIAATLNTLLFRTHLPAGAAGAAAAAAAGSAWQQQQQRYAAQQAPGGTRQGARQYSGKGPQYSMLADHAPVLLRAMYERDARRPFCPPSLWLEPYHNAASSTPALASTSSPSGATSPPSAGPSPRVQHALVPPSPTGSPTASGGTAGTAAGGQQGGGRLMGLMRGLAGRRSSSSGAGEAAAAAEEAAAAEQSQVAGWGAAAERRPAAASGGFSAAAVVRALLNTADADDAEAAGQGLGSAASTPRAGHPPPQQPGAAAVGVPTLSQPSALAAILVAAPQCVPFDERVSVFRALIDMDKERGKYDLAPIDGGPRPLPVTIRRTHILEDALAQLQGAGEGLKRRLYVTFINEQGLQEAGLDQGGLMKELVETVAQAGFDRNRGLFSATPDGFAYPNPLAERLEGGLASLELLGSMLGKALYEGILVDMPLAPFFVSKLQGRWPLFDELAALDEEVYRSLVSLKRYEGDAQDLALDFTVETDAFGAMVSEELVPGGSSIAVTSANMLQYVYLVADWHLNKRLGVAAAAFGRGLAKIIPPSWLRLFSPREVNQLLGGGEGGEIDVSDMQRYARYSGGYTESSSAVRSFWKVVEGMSQEERRALLKFVTSCSRAPLGGFQHLTPQLTIHKVDCDANPLALLGGKDVDRLPSSSTCYNMLKLPNYRRTATMREKLLYAIKSGAGFELS